MKLPQILWIPKFPGRCAARVGFGDGRGLVFGGCSKHEDFAKIWWSSERNRCMWDIQQKLREFSQYELGEIVLRNTNSLLSSFWERFCATCTLNQRCMEVCCQRSSIGKTEDTVKRRRNTLRSGT